MAKFVTFVDNAQAHRWRLVDDNGRIIADSAEGYVSLSNAHRAIDNVRDAISNAEEQVQGHDLTQSSSEEQGFE